MIATLEPALTSLLRPMAMERTQGIIDNLEVKAPVDGVVSVKENRDGQYFFFTGMVLPQYREGDSTSSGRNIADIVEAGKMEVRAKVTETDRLALYKSVAPAVEDGLYLVPKVIE